MAKLFDNSLVQSLASLPEDTVSFAGITFNPFAIVKGILVMALLLWVSGMLLKLMDRRLRRVADMRASTRILIVKLAQFFLYCIVFFTGMQLVGINLTALSVFSGALGVGIGFGLQKIASNFISGIILLFEKSIEVDDLIEMADGTVGFLRRTNARYTLLQAFDGREIMIPNDEFINQRVTSWTHSDRQARIEVTVSVAYDSDIDLVKKLMLQAVTDNAKPVESHPPACAINAFQDSGIQMLLYFWVPDVMDGRLEPKSEVMGAILKSFKANNITIPFPQSEVRVTQVTKPEDGI